MQRCDCASVQLRKGNHAPQSLFALALAVLMFVSPGYAFPLLNLQAAQVASPLQNAGALIQQGQFEQARKILEEQVALDPSNVDVYNLLGIVYTNEKDFDRADDAFQRALKLAPDSTKIQNNLGNLYVAQKKFDLAEREFRNVLRMEPSNRDANYNLGLVLMAKGTPVAAIQHFQRVHPVTIEVRFNLIRAYLEAGKTSEGLQTARELSAAHAGDVQLHFTLGVLLASEKQYNAAQLELERANSLQPETFEILHNLGQAYLRGHNYAKAELTLNRALKLKPDSPETLYLLAQVYSEQSRPVDALDLLVRAHKLAPAECRCDFPDGSREHESKLLRRCNPLARSRSENCSAAGGFARSTRRELFHVGQGGTSHRRVQESHYFGPLGSFLRIHGAVVSSSRAI